VPIPFYGELGAVNPVVVLPGAAASSTAEIASGYAGSLTLGAGQFCTNPGLLFVPADDVALSAAVTDAVGASSGGPMLSERIFKGYEAALAEIEAHPAVTAVAAGTTGEGPWGATPRLFQTTLKDFAADLPVLAKERFGPAGLMISYPSVDDLVPVLAALEGNLVGSVHGDTASAADVAAARQVIPVFQRTVGRVVWNAWPTGVAVNAAQHHGGPWPATTVPAYTSVGSAAIRRWLIPVAYQNVPAELLPARLAD
jgi:NADP-dependent aldehyde dehydrogenase